MVTDPHELQTIDAMVRMVRDYLTLAVPVLGAVRASPAVRASIDERRPLLLDPSAGRIGAELRRIASAVLEAPPAAPRLVGGEVVRAPAKEPEPRMAAELAASA
jgi:hypothetical protein